MKKLILLLSVLLFSLEFVAAQDEYERCVFVSSSGDSLNYRLLEPEVMQAGEKYPLVLFLHGAGERGNDNEKQLTHGGQMFLNPVNREKYPAFVLFPQCPESGYWAYENRPQSFIPTQMPVGKEMPSVFQASIESPDPYLHHPQVETASGYIMFLLMVAM